MENIREIKSAEDLYSVDFRDKIKVKGMEGIVKNIIYGNSVTILRLWRDSIREIKYNFCLADGNCNSGRVVIYDKGNSEYNDYIKFLTENSK